jgi:PAS domain S-box-containing protein
VRVSAGGSRAGFYDAIVEGAWRALIDGLPQLVWACLPDGTCDFLSRRWAEFTGASASDLVGMGWIEHVHPDDRARLMAAWDRSVQTGSEFVVEFRIRRHDGVYRWFDTRALALRDDSGRIVRWFGSNTDIDDAVALRATFEEQQARFAQVAALAPGAIVSIKQRPDGSGSFLYASPGLEELYGLRPEDVRESARAVAERVHPDDREEIRQSLARSAASRSPWQQRFRVIHPSRGQRWIEANTAPVSERDGSTVWHGFMHDITDRMMAEQQLMSAQARLRSAVSATGMGTFFRDLRTGEERVDAALARLWGRTTAEVGTMAQARDFVHHDDRAQLTALTEALISGHPVGPAEFRVLRPDGTASWMTAWGRVDRDSSGRRLMLSGVVIDVTTQRREADARARSQKLEALGTLASGVAHDFNNVLQAIIGNLSLAQEDLGPAHPVAPLLADIGRATDRATALVHQILSFSRSQEGSEELVDLGTVVEEATSLLRAVLPRAIELRFDMSSEVPAVLADPNRIHQIVVNLVTNAAQAMEDAGGTIRITLASVVLAEASTLDGLQAGPYTCLSVADDGHGMDAETAAHAFDPFFTTKQSQGGTGLGLAIVHTIMRAHGGTVVLESEPRAGTTLRLYFPAADGSPSGSDERAPTASLAALGHKVLYVDDEPMLADLGARLLTRIGLDSATFTAPHKALESFRTQPYAYDAVITDLSMPGMTGIELARQMLVIRPDVPIVVLSGHVDEHQLRQARELGVRDLLLKPATINALRTALSRILTA